MKSSQQKKKELENEHLELEIWHRKKKSYDERHPSHQTHQDINLILDIINMT